MASLSTAVSTDGLLRRLRRVLPEGGLLGEESWASRAILVLLALHAVVIAAVVAVKGFGPARLSIATHELRTPVTGIRGYKLMPEMGQ